MLIEIYICIYLCLSIVDASKWRKYDMKWIKCVTKLIKCVFNSPGNYFFGSGGLVLNC